MRRSKFKEWSRKVNNNDGHTICTSERPWSREYPWIAAVLDYCHGYISGDEYVLFVENAPQPNRNTMYDIRTYLRVPFGSAMGYHCYSRSIFVKTIEQVQRDPSREQQAYDACVARGSIPGHSTNNYDSVLRTDYIPTGTSSL